MTRHFTVALVSGGDDGGAPCKPVPCIILQGPKTPPPKGDEVAELLDQILTSLPNVELDYESIIQTSESLEEQAQTDDALILADFALRRLTPTAPTDIARRALDVQHRIHTALGNQTQIDAINARIDELTLLSDG